MNNEVITVDGKWKVMQFTCLHQVLFKEEALTLIQIVPISKSPLAGRWGTCMMSLGFMPAKEPEYVKKKFTFPKHEF